MRPLAVSADPNSPTGGAPGTMAAVGGRSQDRREGGPSKLSSCPPDARPSRGDPILVGVDRDAGGGCVEVGRGASLRIRPRMSPKAVPNDSGLRARPGAGRRGRRGRRCRPHWRGPCSSQGGRHRGQPGNLRRIVHNRPNLAKRLQHHTGQVGHRDRLACTGPPPITERIRGQDERVVVARSGSVSWFCLPCRASRVAKDWRMRDPMSRSRTPPDSVGRSTAAK
jgi:hypothetical protein